MRKPLVLVALMPNRVRYLRVYARRQGQWKAVSQMSTPVADP